MVSPGQKRGSCGHLMAAFDAHSHCACYHDKGKGNGPCVIHEDCPHCYVQTNLPHPPSTCHTLKLIVTLIWTMTLLLTTWTDLILFVQKRKNEDCLTRNRIRPHQTLIRLSQESKLTMRNIRSFMGWKHIPDFDHPPLELMITRLLGLSNSQ